MTEPDGWTTPSGWGGPAPSTPPPAPSGQPTSGQPGYGQPSYGQPPYGEPGYGQPPYGGWGSRPPELKPGVVPLRPLGLGEVLDGAVGVLRRYPRPALGLGAVVAVVSVLVQTLALATALRPLVELDPQSAADPGSQAFTDALGGAVAGVGASGLVGLLSGAVLSGAVTAVVGRAVLGQPMTFGQAWAAVRPVLLKLIGLSLLTGVVLGGVVLAGSLAAALVIALGSLTVGAVGVALGVLVVLATLAAAVYAFVRLSLAPCVLVLERTGVVPALRRSAVLVKGDAWRVLGILLLIFMIGAFVSSILNLPFAALGSGSIAGLFDPERDVLGARPLILSGIGGVITATLVAPFSAGARALLYVDRRMRAEGLDVALAAASARG